MSKAAKQKPLPTPEKKAVPREEWYVPQRGDRVRYVFDDDDEWGEGVIVAAGEQQSTWRADSDRQERTRSNHDFVLVEKAKEGVLPTTAPRQATRRTLEASGFPPASRLACLKAGNPKREGSSAYVRWKLLLDHADRGSIVGDFLRDGGNPTTLQNAVAAGYVGVKP